MGHFGGPFIQVGLIQADGAGRVGHLVPQLQGPLVVALGLELIAIVCVGHFLDGKMLKMDGLT